MAAPELTAAAVDDEGAAIRRRARLLDLLVVGISAAAALALVLPHYATRPFWFDELVSLEVAGLSPRALVDYVSTVEANMALYHALLGAWLGISAGEAGVRALSIAFALLALPFLYALARRLYGRRAAAIAVLLMSVNVSYVGYARDARSYALTLLLVTASAFFLVRALDASHPRDWALYAATAALAVWAHLFAVLVVAAQLAWLLLERRGVRRRHAIVAVSALGALLLPLGLAILLGGQQPQLDWLTRPGPQKLPGLFQWFLESRVTVVLYFLGGATALLAALADRRRNPSRRPRSESLLLLWLLLPPAAGFVVSYASPVYLYRYFLVCLPALVLLVAAGFARMRPVWLGVALVAVTVALSVRTVESCQPDCKIRHDDWEAAAAYLRARARPSDGIVVYPAQVRTAIDHYLGRQRPRLLYPERWALVGGARPGADRLEAALQDAGIYARIWLVTWWLPAEPARDALSERAELLSGRDFQGDVRVELYRPRGPAT
jgi:4-amino-4-deoxy-L-arabinose transferase-like glycosyltransferase